MWAETGFQIYKYFYHGAQHERNFRKFKERGQSS